MAYTDSKIGDYASSAVVKSQIDTINNALAGKSGTGHTHDGRYIRWNGSTADVNNMTWGTLTTANGYVACFIFRWWRLGNDEQGWSNLHAT